MVEVEVEGGGIGSGGLSSLSSFPSVNNRLTGSYHTEELACWRVINLFDLVSSGVS